MKGIYVSVDLEFRTHCAIGLQKPDRGFAECLPCDHGLVDLVATPFDHSAGLSLLFPLRFGIERRIKVLLRAGVEVEIGERLLHCAFLGFLQTKHAFEGSLLHLASQESGAFLGGGTFHRGLEVVSELYGLCEHLALKGGALWLAHLVR